MFSKNSRNIEIFDRVENPTFVSTYCKKINNEKAITNISNDIFYVKVRT